MRSAFILWGFLLCLAIFSVSSSSPEPVHELWTQLWKPRTKSDYSHLRASDIIPESDLRGSNRTIWIITTASLPWMTGTSINPLLRAAYLAKDRLPGKVHLLVPWLNKDDQKLVFGNGQRFNTPEEQLVFIQDWLAREANLPSVVSKLNISFYSARYHDEYHSVFPMGDVSALIPDELADVCVLEEPEHLNWFKAPFTAKSWMDKFNHVVGVIHTNYVMYSKTYTLGQIKGPLLYFINQGMCRAYCHKIIKLSGALQEFAPEKEVVANVHGVRTKYLTIGDAAQTRKFTKGAYFVGKMAWPKGLGELFQLMNYVAKRTGKCFPIDIYGQGPHLQEIIEVAKAMKLPATFFGSRDHADLVDYRVFVNPSLSEVLCTTIVEALAMGKWVVCAKHPSNEFFEQFPNCLIYRNEEEFAANVIWALHHDPHPLTAEQRHALSWEAATDRFLNAALITKEMQTNSNSFTDKFFTWMLELLGTGKHGDTVRTLAGGRSAANQIEYINRFGTALPVLSEEDKEAVLKFMNSVQK
eukprot:gene6576-7266_t